MSKKRNKTVRMIAVMIATMLFAVTSLTACNPQHEHTFSSSWEYDDTAHWHAPTCEHSTIKGSVAAHEYSNGVCTVCSYKKSSNNDGGEEEEHVHSYALEWSRNVDYHWHVATCEHTNVRSDYEKHVYSNSRCVHCGMVDPDYTGDLPDMYTLTYKPGLHGFGTAPDVKEYAEGQRFALQPASTFTAEEGWKFVSWSDGSRTFGAGVLFTMPAQSVVLTATWEEEPPPSPLANSHNNPHTSSARYKCASLSIAVRLS